MSELRERLALAAIVLLCACTDEDASIRTLKSAGYTDVSAGGYAWYGCGEDDTSATKFTAKNPAGARVSGIVCCGWGPFSKSCTIRF